MVELWARFSKADLMKAELANFLYGTLRVVATEDFSAQIFVMESGGGGKGWQVAVDLLYRCVESDLVKLYPYGDGMEALTRREYFEAMSKSDPDADASEEWDSAKAWVGTYVIGTMKCVELLAMHGVLNHEATSILAKGLRQQSVAAPESYPNRNFATAGDATSRARILEECVEVSAAIRDASELQEQERVRKFIDAVDREFLDHGVPMTEVSIFPVCSG